MKLLITICSILLLLSWYKGVNAQDNNRQFAYNNKTPQIDELIVQRLKHSDRKFISRLFYNIAAHWDSMLSRQDNVDQTWKSYLNIGRASGKIPCQSRMIFNHTINNVAPQQKIQQELALGLNDLSVVHQSFRLNNKLLYYMDVPVQERELGGVVVSYYEDGFFKQLYPSAQLAITLSDSAHPLFKRLDRASYLDLLIHTLKKERQADSMALSELIPTPEESEMRTAGPLAERMNQMVAIKDSAIINKLVMGNYENDENYIKRIQEQRYGWIDKLLLRIDTILLQSTTEELKLPARVDRTPFLFDGFKDSSPDGKYIVEPLAVLGEHVNRYSGFISVVLSDEAEKGGHTLVPGISADQLKLLKEIIVPVPQVRKKGTSRKHH